MVVEADEAYGSIEMFYPTVAVVTSVDADHLDYYKSVEEIGETFLKFINKVPFYGTAVLCLDSENVQKFIPRVEKRYVTYGLETRADLVAEAIRVEGPTSRYRVRASHDTAGLQNDILGEVHLKMPGRHNIANSLAAIAVGLELDIRFEQIRESLESFQGVHRRFEVLGEADDIIVVDDYAHNPAKLKAALNGAREGYKRRLVGVFQPHRHQRVRDLADEFCRSFYQADVLICHAYLRRGRGGDCERHRRKIGGGDSRARTSARHLRPRNGERCRLPHGHHASRRCCDDVGARATLIKSGTNF